MGTFEEEREKSLAEFQRFWRKIPWPMRVAIVLAARVDRTIQTMKGKR